MSERKPQNNTKARLEDRNDHKSFAERTTREHKPLPSGIRGGAVADVGARREERSLPKRRALTEPLSVKVANGRSKVVSIVHNSYQLPQRIVLLLGAVAVALNTLFAPWVFVLNINNQLHEERFAGYHLITNSNQPQDSTALGEMFHTHTNILAYTSIKLDTQRLFAQLAGILCVTTLCYFAVKARAKIAHSDPLLNAWLDETCPVDGAQMVKRRGEFISCSNYPKCKYIERDIPT